MVDTHVGSVIGGRYTIIDKLGEGGMSVVWLSRDTRLEKLWAIKEIKTDASDATHRADVDLMRKEANIMKNLDHPNIVHVVDIIDENNALYVVMDYVPGKDLAKTMRENRAARNGAVYAYPQEDVIDWGIQLADALGYLHTQKPPVIYRDMKPGNVMLQDDGSVKIIDFGIAREFKDNQSLDTTPLGTRGYASPEAAEKVSQTDARSDIYSLGVTLFHLVTGHSPMEFLTQPNLPPIRQINPSLSPALEQTIIRSTQWDPALRQQSMNELRYELENPVEPAQYLRMRKRLSTFKNLLIVGAVCLVAGIGCYVGSRMVHSSSYDGTVRRAATADSTEIGEEASEAETLYMEAIDIDPGRIEPYLALVEDVYTGDGSFSPQESVRWKKIFKDNQARLEGNEQYAKLCYQAGLNYFLYYTYDEASQGAEAVEWFTKANDAYDNNANNRSETKNDGRMTENERSNSENYLTISDFEKTIVKETKVGNANPTYEKYWSSLESAVVDADNVEPVVQLRLYHTVFRAINHPTHLKGFARVIDQSRVESLLNTVIEKTRALSADVSGEEELEKMYSRIVDGKGDAESNIKSTYNSAGAKQHAGA